jgi:hypothetical protein
MSPAFVAPYRKSGKNDGNDAESIDDARYEFEVNLSAPPLKPANHHSTGRRETASSRVFTFDKSK